MHPGVRHPVPDKLPQPFVVDGVKEATNVRVEHPVHVSPTTSDRERVKRLMLITPGPETVGEAKKILLVNGVQNFDDRPLDNFVLQRGDPKRPLSTAGLRNEHPPRGLGSIRTSMHSAMQIFEICLQALLVLLPCYTIRTRRRSTLQGVERRPQSGDSHVVEERRELHFPVASRDLPHT